MQIYLARNNTQAGPYSLAQVNEMLANGQVLLSDLAWHMGMPEWQKLGELTHGLLVYQPEARYLNLASTQPSDAGRQQPGTQEVLSGPALGAQAKAPNAAPLNAINLSSNLASVNKRVLAKIIDNLIIVLPLLIIAQWVLSEQFLSAFFNVTRQSDPASLQKNIDQITRMATAQDILFLNGYSLFCLVLLIIQVILLAKFGQTIGKKLLKIKVVDEKNATIVPVYRSFLIREFLFGFLYQLLFPVFLLIDFAFLFTDKRRSLHDRLARTLVINASISHKPSGISHKH